MYPLKLQAPQTQKVEPRVVERFLKEEVPFGVANAGRHEGPAMQPSGKKAWQCLYMQFSGALGESKGTLRNSRGSL